MKNPKTTKNLKQKSLVNFKKAQSHIAKVIQMIESNEYCIDIMQQNLAVMGLLRSAHHMLMKNHLNTCFRQAISAKEEKKIQKMIEEILTVTKFVNK